jgi:thiol-disulfide isomerase/thioredoxin
MKTGLYFSLIFFCLNVITLKAQVTGLEIGNKSPEIVLKNQKGDSVALSSLKGKLVLIDFWATWCSPCLEEQPKLAKLYKKYNQKEFTCGTGFEIFGVSLDSRQSSWEEVIAREKITWIQVSDLKFWKSPVAKTYSIKALPYNVLIDRDGIILMKNLHGDELEKALAGFVVK